MDMNYSLDLPVGRGRGGEWASKGNTKTLWFGILTFVVDTQNYLRDEIT